MRKLSIFAVAAGLAVLPAPAQSQQGPDPMLVGQGAQLYSTTCGRCHNPRPAAERTDQEWQVIMAHMRARANMSERHARAVLAFLQATNAAEPGAGQTAARAALVRRAAVPERAVGPADAVAVRLAALAPGILTVQERQNLPDGVTSAMVDSGEVYFKGTGLCFACHGSEGKGIQGVGPDLTDAEWTHTDGSFPSLVQRILEGVPAAESESGLIMPPKGGGQITEEDVRAIAAWIWVRSHLSDPLPASRVDRGPRER